MQKWEYRRFFWSYGNKNNINGSYGKVSDMLDDFGNNGWEVVSAFPMIMSETYWTHNGQSFGGADTHATGEVFIFKRPKM